MRQIIPLSPINGLYLPELQRKALVWKGYIVYQKGLWLLTEGYFDIEQDPIAYNQLLNDYLTNRDK